MSSLVKGVADMSEDAGALMVLGGIVRLADWLVVGLGIGVSDLL